MSRAHPEHNLVRAFCRPHTAHGTLFDQPLNSCATPSTPRPDDEQHALEHAASPAHSYALSVFLGRNACRQLVWRSAQYPLAPNSHHSSDPAHRALLVGDQREKSLASRSCVSPRLGAPNRCCSVSAVAGQPGRVAPPPAVPPPDADATTLLSQDHFGSTARPETDPAPASWT